MSTPERKTRVFLSYAHGDDGEPFDPQTSFAARLYRDLTAAGFDVWFDRFSMASRRLAFYQEIRDAVSECDRLVLVVGPHAVESEYVRQEWQFAWFEAEKAVVPILRQGDYPLAVDELALLHAEDFRDDATYDAHLAELVRMLREPAPPIGKLIAVRSLPEHYLSRPKRLVALREAVRADLDRPVVISGAAARVGLHGMGGIGKSFLANLVARDRMIREAFPDGILWIALGSLPDITALMQQVHKDLGGEGAFENPHSGREKIKEQLAGKAVLLIIDDVWRRDDADAFDVLDDVGGRCRALITTRDAGLLSSLGGTHHVVDLLTDEEARQLLAMTVEKEVDQLPSEAYDLLRECGRLPLAVALAGGMVQAGAPWGDPVDALREHELEFLEDEHRANEQHVNLWKMIEVSVGALEEDARSRLAELAVFPEDEQVPAAAIETLWQHSGNLSPRHARKLLVNLKQRSLVQLTRSDELEPGVGDVSLHDLIHDFAVRYANDHLGGESELHRDLLDAYRGKCPEGWHAGPNDGYFFEHLVDHLLEVEDWDEIESALTDLRFIEAKCIAGLTFDLVRDYNSVLAALPELAAEREAEKARVSRLRKYGADLIAYAQAKGEGVPLPEPPDTRPIMARFREATQLEGAPYNAPETQAGRIREFANFVTTHSHILARFPTETIVVARNHAAEGLAEQGETLTRTFARTWLARYPRPPAPPDMPLCQQTLIGYPEAVRSLAITHDGRWAVSASNDCTLRMWDLQTGAEEATLQGHTGWVTSVAITPDGKRAVSGSSDHTLRVWDLQSGRELRTLEGHLGAVRTVAITPDGRRAFSGSSDHTFRVWDLQTGEEETSIRVHSNSVNSVAITPDGRRAVTACSPKALLVWDMQSGTEERTLQGHSRGVTSVAITPDGRRAVSASKDKTLRVWDLDTGAEERTLQGHSSWVRSVAITPDGRRAVSASGDDTLRVWDLDTGAEERTLQGHLQEVNCVAITPDGRLAVSASSDQTLRVWDLEAGAEEKTLQRHSDWVNFVAISPDGLRAISASGDQSLWVWDLETGAVERSLQGHSGLGRSVAIAPNGRRAVSISGDNALRVWDLETGADERTLHGHSGNVTSVAITPDGLRAVSASGDQTLRVWDLESGAVERTLHGHSGWVNFVAITPDGQQAVSASTDGTSRVWDLQTGREQRTFHGHSGWVESVAITPDGQRAVSAGEDTTLRLWELETGLEERVLQGHSGWVKSVVITHDGRRAVSASNDKTLRVWDLATGKCEVIYPTAASVNTVAIHGADRIVCGTADGQVHFLALRNARS
ncbi:NB-ARC domain-containing protein [Pirellulales bacterium]|nr:NB-ARC domain-containing protein [Pirellulales bacterium]